MSRQKLSLEAFFTSPAGFGLTTATPLQRAICRMAQGVPLGDLGNHPHVRLALGYESREDILEYPHGAAPRELIVISAIRTAKSLFTSCLAVYATQTVDVSKLRPGEIPRVSVLSVKKDLAKVIFNHIVGTIQANPNLKALLASEPTAESIMLMHPSGRPVEITVVPIDRAGASVVARWSAGCIFDEAPRMMGEADGVANYDDCRKAVLARLLPGATLVSVGSPWAPFGPIYEAVQQHWGRPTDELVIVKAPGPLMNPFWWTPERVEKTKKYPAVYRTDCLAEFSDLEESMFGTDMLDRCTRKGPLILPPEPGWEYACTMDPATRGNGWPIIIKTKNAGIQKVALAKQWIGQRGAPLKPGVIFGEIADIVKPYGITHLVSDQWGADPLIDIAEVWGLSLSSQATTGKNKVEMFETLRALMLQELIEIPNDPELRADLLGTKRRVTQNGVQIHLPRTRDGRHGDYAPCLALAVAQYVEDPKPPGPTPDTPEWEIAQAELRRQEVFRKSISRANKEEEPWWAGAVGT